MTRTVLIVDDDEPTQKLLETLVRRSGLGVAVAENGGAAIAVIESGTPLCCIILDLMMPRVNGGAVVDHIAATGRTIPVIVCTAAGPHQTGEFDPAIVRTIVRKPFEIDELLAAIGPFTAGSTDEGPPA